MKNKFCSPWMSLVLSLSLFSGGCGPGTAPSSSDRAAGKATPAAKAAPVADDLFKAVADGAMDKVQSILAEAPALAKAVGKGGDTPLHVAAREGKTEIVKLLVEKEADINLRNYQQRTPLILAIESQHPDIALMLIERGADLKVNTPLIFAAKAGNKEVVQALLAKGADVKAPFEGRPGGKTAMYEAANKEIAQMLFDAGADVNGAHRGSTSPLTAAAERGNREVMEWLLANGADRSPAIVASIAQKALKDGRMEVVDLLARDETIDPAVRVQLAARKGDREVVESCFAKGVNLKDSRLHEALREAAGEGHLDVVEFLVGNGVRDSNGMALVKAVENGRTKVAEFFLDNGGNVQKGWDNFTLLHFAGNREVAELLLARGADLQAKRWCGRTPLFRAAEENRKDVVELLVEKGADVNVLIKFGGTPLIAVVKKNLTDMARLLVERGADVNAKDELEATALHYAVTKDNVELAELLLKKGANPDAPLGSKASITTYRQGEAPNPFAGQSAEGRTPASLANSEAMKALFSKRAGKP